MVLPRAPADISHGHEWSAKRLEGEFSLTTGSETSGYDEERQLLKRYLSDEIAPMIFANNASELFEVPPEVVAAEIYSWIGDQIAGATNMTAADLIYHAATKLHQLGVLELIPSEEINQYLNGLHPHLLGLCPAEQRRGLEENFRHLERSTDISGSKVEVLHKQGGGASPGTGGGYPGGYGGAAGPGGGGSGGGAGGGVPTAGGVPPVVPADPAALYRLNLLLDQLQRPIAPPAAVAASAAADHKAVLAHVIEEVASQAGSSKELETQLQVLQDLGVGSLDSGIFQALSHGLPDWAPPPHTTAEVAGEEPPAGAARAMRKVVNLSKNKDERLGRFKELVSTAIVEFNGGSLGRAVTMLDLADRMISQREVEASIADTVTADSFPDLDQGQLHAFADDPDKRLLLHRLMSFFPKLRVEELLDRLKVEEDREKRLQIIKLVRAHGSRAREVAVEALDESVNGVNPEPWHVERNLLYLMRAIPPPHDGDIEREIDLLIRTSDLTRPVPVVRESFTTLAQLEHPRGPITLDARISELEDALKGTTEIALNLKETRWLLSFAIKQLAQNSGTEARAVVITHGLKGQPHLGDTYARLAPLGDQDLSDSPEQLDRLVEALRQELPRRFLGLSVKNDRKSQIVEQLLVAVSGSATPEVKELLSEIAKKYPDQSYGRTAEQALINMGQPITRRPRAADDSITLTGDLALFGLPNLLQNLADTGVTGIVTFFDTEGNQAATIELAEGALVTAAFGNLTEDLAVFQMLERPMEGRFEFVNTEEGEEARAKAENAKSMMSLLLEGIRRYDEFHRALALVPDDARFKAAGKKPTDVKEDPNPQLAKELWGKAIRGVSAAAAEPELSVDSYGIRRLYEHWVTEGSLVRLEDSS